MNRLTALHKHWRMHPRLEWLAAAYFKYEPKPDTKEDEPDKGLLELFSLMGIDASKPGQKVVG
jgi:hypothetical protein